MKKFLSIIALGLFAGISAQTEFGVKAGYNLSGMKLEADQFQSTSYFYLGGLVNHKIKENFSLQGELLFTQLGGKNTEVMNEFFNGEIVVIRRSYIKFQNSQLQLPISAKYYFVPNFSISGGLNFGFNISKKFETDFSYNGITSGDTDLFKTVNIFPFLGAEYKITNNIFVDARYHFGAFNASVSNAPKTKISFLQAGVGYRFN